MARCSVRRGCSRLPDPSSSPAVETKICTRKMSLPMPGPLHETCLHKSRGNAEIHRAKFCARVHWAYDGHVLAKADSVKIVPADPAWGEKFEKGAAVVRSTLGVLVLGIEHIGSTS